MPRCPMKFRLAAIFDILSRAWASPMDAVRLSTIEGWKNLTAPAKSPRYHSMPSPNRSIPLPHGSPAADLLSFAGTHRFGAVLADPPWQFQNRTGKVAPEHRRLNRY